MSSFDRFFQALEEIEDILGPEVESDLQRGVRLSVKEHDFLRRLLEVAPDGIRMNELAEGLMMSPSGLTRLVDRLEREGLIQRLSCPTDLRGHFAHLTPEGEARCREADAVRVATLKRLLGNSDHAFLQTLARDLQQVGVGIRAHCGEARRRDEVAQAR